MKKVIVVGGGASGMMAAISAARAGADVCILEHNDKLGKKILATGNGRCNFTNRLQEPCCYRSSQKEFPWRVISQFPAEQTISFFEELGICAKDRGGYLYPGSDQASSVMEVLQMEVERLQIQIEYGAQIHSIRKKKERFEVRTHAKVFWPDALILATGSRASSTTGSDGSGYAYAKAFGHTLTPVLPALVALHAKEKFFVSLAGVRIHGKGQIFTDGKKCAEDTGEIQLTKYGISGIPVFQVSRYAAEGIYRKKEVTAVLDVAPDLTEQRLEDLLEVRIKRHPEREVNVFFTGMYPQKFSQTILKLSKIDKKKRCGELNGREITILCRLLKSLRITIVGTNDFDQAQICAGGVRTEEVSSETLESCYVPGLYFAGELLDVDGICGGYNLQWAWSSGAVAGKCAAQYSMERGKKVWSRSVS